MKAFMNNKITKIILSLIIVLLTYIYLCFLFLPKEATDRGYAKYYRSVSMLEEEKNSIDILFYGNSDLSSGIIPMQIFKDAGYTSYLRWGNQHTLNSVYDQVKQDVKSQKPKLIVLEVDCVYYPNKPVSDNDFYGNFWFAPFAYHTRWKDISFRDFAPYLDYEKDYHKGYNYQTIKGEYTYKDYMGTSDKAEPIEKSVLKRVKQIKKICDKNNIQFMFIEAPSPSSWNMKKHNGIVNLAKELEVNFIDFNLPVDDFNFDYSNDFRDKGNHCNFKGATKVTACVTKYIQDNYDLPDRRLDNNKKYKSWKKDLEKYEQVYVG